MYTSFVSGFHTPCVVVRFSLNQELRQEQRQILTHRMIQSMEILQLAHLQLEQRVADELEQNPLLTADADERAISMDSSAETVHEEETVPDYEHEPEIRLEHAVEHQESTEEFSIADEFAQNYSDTIDEAPIRSQNWLEDQESFRADAFANAESPGETLQTYLSQQIDWFDLAVPLREMCLRIINNLDTNGYFPYEWEDFLGEDHTEEEVKLAEEALAQVKRLDPTGVGGKNLRECLLMQVSPDSRYAAVLKQLITSGLEYISTNRLAAIAKKLGLPLDIVQEAVVELRHFNPRPGSGFGGSAVPMIIPDVIVEKSETGKYLVRIEDGRLPSLRVNTLYKDLLGKEETDRDTKTYIRKKVGAARWLISAIEQRRQTLLKVSQAIVDYQTDFFEYGPQALKPLKMQQIAEVVGMHVTTISRACDDKWLASPRGIFPFRRFFVVGLAVTGGGDDVANDVIRLKIQNIIDNEDKNDPLTDEVIAKLLVDEGMQVARRTVMKYRQLMDIPSSRSRRQWD